MNRTTPEEKLRIAEADLASDHPAVLAEERLFQRDPGLYRAFETATLRLLGLGYTRFSQWMVANYVRYNVMSEARILIPGAQGEAFKVPNGVIAVWARMFIVNHPEHADVFTIKAMMRETE